jgi:hypothetical protein
MNIRRLLVAAFAVIFFVDSALAQSSGSVTNHAYAIGKGPGVTGFSSLLCTSAQLAVGQTAADPICRTVTGDITIDATGLTAIGAGKVTAAMIAGMTSAQLRTILSDEVGTGVAYFVNGALGTPASGTGTNLTGIPIATGISGLGTGFATSAAIAINTASGFVTVNGVLGTPASGTGTNLTGIPIATGISGLGTGVATALAVNTGTNGSHVVQGGALGTPSSGSGSNLSNVINTCGTVSTGTCAMPYFSAYPSAASTTVTSGVSTKMAMNTKVSDSGPWFDAVTNFRFTPLLAGRYLVHIVVACGGTPSTCVAEIFKNSANYAQQQVTGTSSAQGVSVSAIVTMNGSTDFVEADVLNVCGGTCTYLGGTAPMQSFFEASYISP